LYTWKRNYADGKLTVEPSREAELAARVRELECLLGRPPWGTSFKKSCQAQPHTNGEKRKFVAENRTLVQSIQRWCDLMNLPQRSFSTKKEIII